MSHGCMSHGCMSHGWMSRCVQASSHQKLLGLNWLNPRVDRNLAVRRKDAVMVDSKRSPSGCLNKTISARFLSAYGPHKRY